MARGIERHWTDGSHRKTLSSSTAGPEAAQPHNRERARQVLEHLIEPLNAKQRNLHDEPGRSYQSGSPPRGPTPLPRNSCASSGARSRERARPLGSRPHGGRSRLARGDVLLTVVASWRPSERHGEPLSGRCNASPGCAAPCSPTGQDRLLAPGRGCWRPYAL